MVTCFFTPTYLHMHTCAYQYRCFDVYMYLHIHVFAYTHLCIYLYIYIYIFIQRIHVYIYICTCMCIYIFRHTQKISAHISLCLSLYRLRFTAKKYKHDMRCTARVPTNHTWGLRRLQEVIDEERQYLVRFITELRAHAGNTEKPSTKHVGNHTLVYGKSSGHLCSK